MTKYTPREQFSKGSKSGTAPAALQNFSTNTSQVTQKSDFSCRFCGAQGHSALVSPGITHTRSDLTAVGQLGCVPCVPAPTTTKVNVPARMVN